MAQFSFYHIPFLILLQANFFLGFNMIIPKEEKTLGMTLAFFLQLLNGFIIIKRDPSLFPQ